MGFTETPFEDSPDDWLEVEGSDTDSLRSATAKGHKFNVAFGLSDHADSPGNVEDHLYGNLVAQRTFRTENGTLEYSPIDTVPC